MRAAAALLALIGTAPAQDAPARFRALTPTRQALVVRSAEQQVSADPDPGVQRILSLYQSFSTFPEATPREFHDPKRWAKGAAPERTLIEPGTPEHDLVLQKMPKVELLADLHKAVFYDWGKGQVVRRSTPLSFQQRFENLLAGYTPGSDVAVARVLAALDQDQGQRPLAAYLEHLYADLQARVYRDVTLYQAWYSGQILDVPDVDAIPFAVQLLDDTSFHSPIPNDARRARLYQQIRDRVAPFRKYRTLREAGAAAFVRAEPQIDPLYQPLVPRFHYLFATHGDDAAAVARLLQKNEREALIGDVDSVVKGGHEAFAVREGRKQELLAMAERVRAAALEALAKVEQPRK
jgi:hypothetical protein